MTTALGAIASHAGLLTAQAGRQAGKQAGRQGGRQAELQIISK